MGNQRYKSAVKEQKIVKKIFEKYILSQISDDKMTEVRERIDKLVGSSSKSKRAYIDEKGVITPVLLNAVLRNKKKYKDEFEGQKSFGQRETLILLWVRGYLGNDINTCNPNEYFLNIMNKRYVYGTKDRKKIEANIRELLFPFYVPHIKKNIDNFKSKIEQLQEQAKLEDKASMPIKKYFNRDGALLHGVLAEVMQGWFGNHSHYEKKFSGQKEFTCIETMIMLYITDSFTNCEEGMNFGEVLVDILYYMI